MNQADPAGKQVLAGRYGLLHEIGRGGMATVYLADDKKHSRRVAVKVLDPAMSAAIGADRFSREIKLVARLQHPHILPLYDSGEADGALFFVMPFVEGESLRARLAREKSLLISEVATIIRHIGDALDYAHARGVVHRDIKPENIMLSAGQALLADFGIARIETRDELGTLTAVGTTLGTPAYMSPEQAAGDENIDGWSDLYSLGCVCFEMLSGSPPFWGETTRALITQHVIKAPPPVTSPRHTLPQPLIDVLGQLLSKDPAERPASAADFATVLEDAAYELRLPSRNEERLKAVEHERANRKSVFVLDFTNISGSTDIDWLSSGIAETIGVDLKRIAGIKVVGSDTATRQRVGALRRSGRLDAETARELGKSVGARWVVWGGFQKSGPRIRLTPHFSDTETAEVVSADKIDGAMEDIFTLQDTVVTRLADVLRIKLTTEEVEQIARPETSKLTAYELYAKGQQAFQLFGKESARIASEHFRQAVEIDPDYALAWSGLGSLLMPKYIASGSSKDLDDGVAALQRAMELDPSMGEPYVFLAYMYGRQHRYDEAIAAARNAVDRDPGSHMSWYLLGLTHSLRGFEAGVITDIESAVPPYLRAGAINPSFHPAWMMVNEHYTARGAYTHATKVIDKAIAMEKSGTGLQFLGSYVQRAVIHLHLGELDAAEPWLDLAIRTYPTLDHVYADTMTAFAYFTRGLLEERRGNDARAQSYFVASCGIADSHDHRLGVGAFWVKSKLGLARIAWRRGDRAASDEALLEALTMNKSRTRFVWGMIMGTPEAATWYEAAATHAVRGEIEESLAALRKAADFGWADMNQFNHDPSFAGIIERNEFRAVATDAVSRVTLPPPVGTGGLPSLDLD